MRQLLLIWLLCGLPCILSGMEKPSSLLDRQLIKFSKNDKALQVKICLALGADPNAVDEFQASSFLYAVSNQNLALMQCLSDHGANRAHVSQGDFSALHITAMLHVKARIARWLIEHHLPLDVQDEEGCTPFFQALKYKHPKIARLLFEYGARVDISNNVGQLPEDIDRDSLFDLCYEPLRRAIITSDLVAIKRFLDQGANVNFVTHQGTVWHWLAVSDAITLVFPMIFLYMYNKNRQTAEIQDKSQLLKVCLQARDSGGLSPLHWAAQEAKLHCWCYLMRLGSSLTMGDTFGHSALCLLDICHALHGWESRSDLTQEMYQFLTAPIGSAHELSIKQELHAHKTVLTALCTFRKLAIPRQLALKICSYLPEVRLEDILLSYHKSPPALLIEKMPMKYIAYAIKQQWLREEVMIEAYCARHIALLRSVIEKERARANFLFVLKLERCLADEAFATALRDAYKKALSTNKEAREYECF